MYGEGGPPGTVPLHNLRVTSHVLHQEVPLGGTEYVSFELFLGILRGLGRGEGAGPCTAPLQNPQVTSRKACLRNADIPTLQWNPSSLQNKASNSPNAQWRFAKHSWIALKARMLQLAVHFQGAKRRAFGKRCLCPRDTRHFRHFVGFTGSEQQSPCLTSENTNSSFLPLSSKRPLFGGGERQNESLGHTPCMSIASTHMQ